MVSQELFKIIVIPGMMGSALKDIRGGQGTLWVHRELFRESRPLKSLKLAQDGTADLDERVRLTADGPVPILYDRVIDAFARSNLGSPEFFPYDWRKPVVEAATDLEALLRNFLAGSPDRSVVLVAHSMGGLVAGHAIADLGRMVRQVKGIIAFGVPWLGSYAAALALRGEGSLVRLLAAATRLETSAFTDVLQTFWGWTDLLPVESPLLSRSFYDGPLLSSRAGELQLRSPTTIRRSVQVPVLPIVGKERSTPIAITEKAFELHPVMGEGDGMVPLVSAAAVGTIAPVIVPGNHFRLTLEPEGIQAAVRQAGQWLHGSTYRIPEDLVPDLSNLDLGVGRIRQLKATLSKSLAPLTGHTLSPGDWWTLLEHL